MYRGSLYFHTSGHSVHFIGCLLRMSYTSFASYICSFPRCCPMNDWLVVSKTRSVSPTGGHNHHALLIELRRTVLTCQWLVQAECIIRRGQIPPSNRRRWTGVNEKGERGDVETGILQRQVLEFGQWREAWNVEAKAVVLTFFWSLGPKISFSSWGEGCPLKKA